jgi:energy-coupling factor transporter ATP-binding protein EcfA2
VNADRIDVESLSVDRVDARGSSRTVLSDVDLRVEPGERVFLVGPNAAGKTTLLLALVGALPFRGTVRIGPVTLSKKCLARARERIGFVFANPSDQLFCATVAEEVAFGPERLGLPPAERRRRTESALGAVALERLSERDPAELSLGEQRRLALAAALSLRPGVLLFDEPTASLDPKSRSAVLRAMTNADSTLVVATHDLEAALEVEGAVVVIREGRVHARGPAAAVLRDRALMRSADLEVPRSLLP